MRLSGILAVAATGLFAFMPSGHAAAASVEVVVSAEADGLEQHAAAELRRYLGRLFDVSPTPVASPGESVEYVFFLGTWGRTVGGIPGAESLPKLSDQGYLLRSAPWKEKPAMVIVGGSSAATMWGVYELVERYGVRYLLSGDVYPDTGKALYVPQIDQVFEPGFRVRMWKAMGDFAFGMEGWGMADYRPFLDQLAKLKFNRIRVNAAPTQPFLDLQITGIQRQTATLWYGARFPITDDMPGRQLFGNEAEFWNPDLPLPERDPASAGCEKIIAAGVRHVHELVAYAHRRGIGSTLVGSITDFPKEYAPVVPGAQVVNQLGELTVAPGPAARPDNAQLKEIAGAVLGCIVDTYPEIDSYGFPVGTEWPSWVELYDWAWQELDARYGIHEVTSLEAVLQAAGKRTAYTGGAERAVRQVKGDLTGLSFLERLRTDPDILPKSRKPDARLAYYEISEELFPILPRVLPKDAELHIVLDYTPTRVLRRVNVLDTVPAKEVATVMVLTLQDDGVGVPPQLTTGSVHKLVSKMRERGLSGFCTRQWMISDLDPSVAYLAKAAWDATATPESVSRDQIRAVCGEAAVEPMLEAFREVETVTAGLEDHALGIGFPVPQMIMRHWSPDAFPKELSEDREAYRRALAAVQKAPAPATQEGEAYVRYWVGRLEFAIGFFDTIEAVKKAAAAEQAVKDAKQKGDEAAVKAKSAEAIELANGAQTCAFQAIDTLAKVAKNRSDLGAIATMAEYIYRPLKRKAEELRGAAATPTR